MTVHVAPPKPPGVALNDARFHLENAMRSLELAQRGFKGDSRERMRVRLRAVKQERRRVELFMVRHDIELRGPSR